MKSFFHFFLIVFIIYTVANVYLFVRGWQALEIVGRQRVWFVLIFWIVAYSFFITQLMQVKGVSGVVFNTFNMIGSCWIAVMLYGFLILFALDILRIAGWIGHIRPDFIYRNYPLTKIVIFGAVCFFLSIILAAGYINAHHIRPSHVKMGIDKKAGNLTQLRVVMVSDLHLGTINGRKSLSRIVDAINKQEPDIVLLAGDIFDNSSKPAIKRNAGVEFDRLQTKYGVWFTTGNHEYIAQREMKMEGAMETTVSYLTKHGVTPLLDTVVLIDNSFYIAGRKDRSARDRKTVAELLNGIDTTLPIITIDHQPYRFDEVEQAGVDLHLCGHTHHGQMWPLNYITRRMYEIDWGYLQKGKSHFWVSCGAGTWGPPIRTTGYSEVVVMDLSFQ